MINILKEIYTNTFSFLSKDDSGRNKKRNSTYCYFKVLPVVLSTLLVVSNIYLDKDIISYLISFISIFAGLFFALIFIVVDKFNVRRNTFTTNNDEDVNYIERYKLFSIRFINQISYLILVSILLILIMIFISVIIPCNSFDLFDANNKVLITSEFVKYSLWVICYTFSYFFLYTFFIQYILMLVLLVINLYRMMMEDVFR